MKSSRRITVVSPFRPRSSSPHGAPQVIHALVESVARAHQVTVIATVARPVPPDDALAASGVVERLIVRPRGPGRARRLRRLVALVRGRTPWAADWKSPEFDRAVQVATRRSSCDLVHVEFVLMADSLGGRSDCAPVVITDHDPPVAMAWERLISAPWRQRPLRALELQAWIRTLRRASRRAAAFVVFDEEDRGVLERFVGDTPVLVMPYPVACPAGALDPSGGKVPTIAFVGSYRHPPNVDAVELLVDRLMPELWRHVPDLRLLVIGADPPAAVLDVDPRVVVTGYVADLPSVLDDVNIVVAPTRTGRGMRVKTIEAMAHGKAVVASPKAAAGLPDDALRHLLVARDDAEFVEHVIELLGDERRRTRLACGARAWAADWLSTERVDERYAALLREIDSIVERRESPTWAETTTSS